MIRPLLDCPCCAEFSFYSSGRRESRDYTSLELKHTKKKKESNPIVMNIQHRLNTMLLFQVFPFRGIRRFLKQRAFESVPFLFKIHVMWLTWKRCGNSLCSTFYSSFSSSSFMEIPFFWFYYIEKYLFSLSKQIYLFVPFFFFTNMLLSTNGIHLSYFVHMSLAV